MKKLISIIALFAILFSSMGTSISVYAENTSISSGNNQEDGEVIQQEEQAKLGGLAESNLYNLLKNRDYTQDGLIYLINLRGNLTKTEKAVLLRESEIKSKIANKSLAIKIKVEGIYNKLFLKLAKSGLNKSQYQEFARLNIVKEEKKVNTKQKTKQKVKANKFIFRFEDENINNNNSFLQKRTDISRAGNGAYQVNFKSITGNGAGTSLKAGKVQAIFKSKANFPKKLILPAGFTYNVNTTALDSDFIKTNALKQKIENLSVDVGQIVIKEPELRILPDRIQYVKKTALVFKNETQLNNIKANLSKEFGDKNINSMINQLKQTGLKNVSQLKKGKLTRAAYNNLQLQGINTSGLQIATQNSSSSNGANVNMPDLSINNINNGYNSELFTKAPGANKINPNILARFNDLSDENIDQTIQEECNNNLSLTQQQKDSCANSDNFERIIETEEVIGYSLIPSTIEDLRKNKKSLIAINPNDIRLSRSEIFDRFNKLKAINLQQKLTGDDYTNLSNSGTVIPAIDVYSNENYCSEVFEGNPDKITKCEEAKTNMREKTPMTYSQDLLNGFTIGETKSYSWGTSASVYIPFVGSIKVFKVKFGFSYGYAFGIRIPIHVEGGISDNKVYNFGDKGDYDTWIKVSTLDADEAYYKNILDNNDYSYKGKEFVFEFTSSANIYVWVKGLGDVNVNIPLVSSLIVGLVAAATVSTGDPVKALSDVAGMFGTNKDNLQSFIKNNGIDLSKNFKPPFAGETIPLYRLESPEIPLYTDGLLKLVAKLGVKSELGGRITTKCSEVNSEGACPTNNDSAVEVSSSESVFTQGYDENRLHINTTGKYEGHGKAVDGPDNEMIEDPILGSKYSKFGIKFSDFRYHPELIFILFAKAGAGVHIPYIGWATYWTPDIDLYTFKFSSDNLYLGQHEGTVGVFDMTQTASGVVNRVYTVKPPKLEKVNYIGSDNSLYTNLLVAGPDNSTKGGNNIYFKVSNSRLNIVGTNTNPSCNAEFGTKKYIEGANPLWATYKTDLQNTKNVYVKAIACNGLYKTKTDIYSKTLNLQNTYHKPFFVLGDTINGGFVKITKGTVLDVDNNEGLQLTMNSKSLEGEIVKSNDTKEYIKYKISSNKNINLTCSNGTLYNGEKFEFSRNREKGNIENNIISLGTSDPISTAGFGNSVYLEIVKCAIKDNNTTFESFHNKLHIIGFSSGANNYFKDKAHGGAVLQQVKRALEQLGDFRADVIGGYGRLGEGVNPGSFYSTIDGDGYNKMSLSVKTLMSNSLNLDANGLDIDRQGGLDKFKGGNSQFGGFQTMNFNGLTLPPKPEDNKKITSSDEYVNEKLKEINDCFINTYNSHLDNLNKTIKNFEKTRDDSRNEATKRKYQKAINKLNEIKSLFIERYKNVLEYNK